MKSLPPLSEPLTKRPRKWWERSNLVSCMGAYTLLTLEEANQFKKFMVDMDKIKSNKTPIFGKPDDKSN